MLILDNYLHVLAGIFLAWLLSYSRTHTEYKTSDDDNDEDDDAETKRRKRKGAKRRRKKEQLHCVSSPLSHNALQRR